MEPWTLLGIACVAYTLMELAAVCAKPSAKPAAGFGAVDVESGRPLRVVVDRRCSRDRRTV